MCRILRRGARNLIRSSGIFRKPLYFFAFGNFLKVPAA